MKKHHSYESAIMLSRILRAKQRILQELNNSTLGDNFLNNKPNSNTGEEAFKKIIKIILFHDYDLKQLISFNTNFWECFLMVVDEMQDYGRPYQDSDRNMEILSPLRTGFGFVGNKIRLCIAQQPIEKQLEDAYKCHSYSALLSKLEKRIERHDLDRIFAV